MENPLWKFTDAKGTFVSETAHKIKSLYLPLCNHAPFMSCVTPDLHGDIKTGFNSFLVEPVSRASLWNLKSSRNFWVYINPDKIWSVTGASKDTQTIKKDKFKLEAGLLWHRITRRNVRIGLEARITSFIPATSEPAEIMQVVLTNISSKPVSLTPAAAIPLFARSCRNLHDHRHVTSLLNRIEMDKFGVIVTPTLSFDESGHKKNTASYFVLGIDGRGAGPRYIYPTQEEFTGEGGDLEAPNVILHNLLPEKKRNPQGREAMAALRFKTGVLKPGHSLSYIILMGITETKAKVRSIFHKFDTPVKVGRSLEETRSYWQEKGNEIILDTGDATLDNWLRWVNIQPVLRRIFGCSFLPDFDYGKGGRGWRDLWQDCLALALNNPREARPLILNNFPGVRIDGSNATIIGQKPGEFIADRNNISRVWMDHGIWPLLTTHLYIHQSGDLKILFQKAAYFRDHQVCRGRERDWQWKPEYGSRLKTKGKDVYQGTILEHLLVQNLVQFFNVGPHNHIRLEDADWNDGLDMASEHGESVAFTAMYGYNLSLLSEILEKIKERRILVFKELLILLDSLSLNPVDYSSVDAKNKLLNRYFSRVKTTVSGKVVPINKSALIRDLKKKSDWISRHIQKTEWLKKEGFFNGYYNNDKKRLEGKINGLTRMTLTGQTFPIMGRVAGPGQVRSIFKNAKKYLQDKKLGGWHLNTDFQQEQLNLGRAFSFVYGDKENGAFFNHMAVMFAYALYSRGHAQEGYAVIDSIYRMAQDTKVSKIYPCLPEYFDAQGRGMYSYLTGSASWFLLTILTQVFGVRGEYGNLLIEPKLVAAQFKFRNTLSISAAFAERPIEIRFINPRKKDFGRYFIRKVTCNQKIIFHEKKDKRFSFPRNTFLALTNNRHNIIEVVLD